jgi:ketosteroid isomerase-like protein
MENQQREQIILHYADAYNRLDIDGMVKYFAEEVIFENIQNEEVGMLLRGRKSFRKQAEEAQSYFSERQQRVLSFSHSGNQTSVDIDYFARLAIDLPNGLRKGQELQLLGRSVFTFEGDYIVKLVDIS